MEAEQVSKKKTYYVIAEVTGSLHVLIDASSKREALARLKEGDWDDKFDVDLKPVGNVQMIPRATNYEPEW